MQPDTYITRVEPAARGGLQPFGSPEPPHRPLGLTPDRVLRLLFGTVAVLLGIAVIWVFARLVVYLLIGIVLAYLLRPLVDRMQGFGLGRVPAILITFALVFGGLGFLVVFIAPYFAGQVSNLSHRITPEVLAEIAGSVESGLRKFLPVHEGTVLVWGQQAFQAFAREERIAATVTSVVDLFANLFYAALVIPFVTFFVLKDGMRLRHSVLKLVPNRYFEIALAIVEKVETNLGRYVGGLLIQCTSVGMLSAVLLAAFGLDNALAVGAFAGIANTIPYFGPLVGLLAGTLAGVSQTGDFSLLPGVLIAMGLTRVADDVLFQPVIFSRAAQAHPLVILFVVLIGAQLAGIIGMLVAIPVATTLRVVAQQVIWSLRNYRILKPA
ncbi:MAG TPA: AI-2E family transporter [Rhodothermales bacterium]|nr:AI-2E family transporter [Rhodothermales bacterium]